MLINNRETLTTMHIRPVVISKTGRQGRPSKLINAVYLRTAMSPKRKISISTLARLIGVHRNTLYKYLRLYNVDYSFSNLPDTELDRIVQAYRAAKPESGLQYLVGFLCSQGLRVQRSRARASVLRVDPVGRVLHARTAIRRRSYKVKRPNALWHFDGHHKLIRYGIVIHGGADGYDRTVSSHSLLYNFQARP
jgi:transposase-like protein